MAQNTLYYGDNLDILRRYVADESVDLVYLDPPFKSNQDYNVLFEERNGSKSKAQIKAFEDTWTWDQTAAAAFEETVESAPQPVSQAMQAFKMMLGASDMLAYLSMMAPRLVELRRVLKPTGSIYLHCDPTASAHLRLLMDAVFGADGFQNNVVWQRFGAHSDAGRFGRVSDHILFYAKGRPHTFSTARVGYSAEHLDKRFRYKDPDGRRFWPNTCLAPGGRGPSYEWNGHVRNWRFTKENMQRLHDAGFLYYSAKGMPYRKNYLDELAGQPVQDIWTDIRMTKSGAERLGYPTQKPEALLERIIKASSNAGDLVLDPFCGCGTAVVVAQKLNRRWIGIDITHLAITLIKHRLRDSFGELEMKDGKVVPAVDYDVIGEPVALDDARRLAEEDPYQFQWWALGLVGARPVEGKKGSDKGIDGRIYFHDEGEGKKTRQIVLSVKGGHTGVAHLRDLRGVLERESAEIGVLITLEKPTRPMLTEATEGGYYDSPMFGKYPRIQVLTVGELLEGKGIEYPRALASTFKKAPKAERGKAAKQTQLDDGQDA
jgi:DNA modification methylase